MKLFSKKDAIAVIILLAVAVILFIIFKPSDHGNLYEISVDGETICRESIYRKSRFELDCGAVIVCDGKSVYFESSDCPDLVCVASGRLSLDGEWAACLPNKTYLKVVSE